jgi:hypothetical protein
MLFLFIFTLIVSFTVVRIGAIAFQLTGLEWSLAKFQALSCFSGTGFTTKEAELITGNKQRRRIASILIVLGNAGLVLMIASLASSFVPQRTILSRLSESFLPFAIPPFLVIWVNLAIVIVMVYVIYRVFTHERFTRRLTNFLRRKIIKKEIIKKVSFEELLLATGGYGVTRVVRGVETIPNPPPDMKILLDDELICFGKLENIRNRICMNP